VSYHYRLPDRPVPRPCVDGAAKCDGCGCSLKTTLDRQLHRCDPRLTTKARRMGERSVRTALR